MKLAKLVLFALAACISFTVAAQRTPVPVVDFKDILVSASTATPLTAEQVKKAITTAALAERWDVTPVADGVLEATFVKGGKHTVVVTIPYTADKYSVLYKSSIDMKYAVVGSGDLRRPVGSEGRYRSDQAATDAVKQRARFEKSTESRYAVAREQGVIHPFYEDWVHHLLDGVRRQLQQ